MMLQTFNFSQNPYMVTILFVIPRFCTSESETDVCGGSECTSTFDRKYNKEQQYLLRKENRYMSKIKFTDSQGNPIKGLMCMHMIKLFPFKKDWKLRSLSIMILQIARRRGLRRQKLWLRERSFFPLIMWKKPQLALFQNP